MTKLYYGVVVLVAVVSLASSYYAFNFQSYNFQYTDTGNVVEVSL